MVLIPARHASTRFPGKPLAQIAGKSMIEWVFSHCAEIKNSESPSTLFFDIAVVTDSPEIEGHVLSFGGQVVRIDDDVPSGTERIYLAWKRHFKDDDYDLIINVQGDEPLLRGVDILKLAQFHLDSQFDITTLSKKETSLKGFQDSNRVKLVWNQESGKCFYFSRSPIPYNRDKTLMKEWWLHVGVYAYHRKALEKFCQLEHGHYENIEKLEQLRALEAGLEIGAIEIKRELIGVDTPEDIDRLEGLL